jgi:hypothetical protein
MTGFFRKGDSLERDLRASRPQPADELISRIEGRVSAARPRRSALRYAIPAALTLALVTALAAVGGVSYAATGVSHAAKAVAKVFTPAKQTSPVVVAGLNAGGDQYRPGFGWGDPNHVHEGPPGLTKSGGAFAPPLVPSAAGKASVLKTSFTLDEQAHLFISVIDKKTGRKLIINQSKSKVGKGLTGNAAKTINYLVLVPRTIPLNLSVPARLLVPGKTYVINVIARDPDGNKTTIQVPFKG